MPSFKASTQYKDWCGTVSADDAHEDLARYLSEKGLIGGDEYLLAVSFFYSEGYVVVRAFVCEGGNLDSVKDALDHTEGPIQVRTIRIDLTTDQFLALFKLFEVVLTQPGLELGGRDYSSAD